MNSGIVLSLKYACLCEKARFFGAQGKIRHILKCASITQGEENWASELITGLDFYKFYKPLAERMGLPTLDPRVVSAYWLGNSGEEFHNWTTLSPVLKLPMERIRVAEVDDCFVHPANVLEVHNTKLVVAYNPVTVNGDELELGQTTKREVSRELLTDKIGEHSFVSIHFGGAIQRIDSETYATLQQLTIDALTRFNATRRAP